MHRLEQHIQRRRRIIRHRPSNDLQNGKSPRPGFPQRRAVNVSSAQAASVEENIPKVGPTGQAKSTDFFSFQNAENLGDIVARKKLKKVLLF
jgi:hypothetical protein